MNRLRIPPTLSRGGGLLGPSAGRLVPALGLLALGAVAASAVARQHARLHGQARPGAAPEHLQTWEGEGGGVPVTAAHTAAQVGAPGSVAPRGQ